jgi:hypothetical protein
MAAEEWDLDDRSYRTCSTCVPTRRPKWRPIQCCAWRTKPTPAGSATQATGAGPVIANVSPHAINTLPAWERRLSLVAFCLLLWSGFGFLYSALSGHSPGLRAWFVPFGPGFSLT